MLRKKIATTIIAVTRQCCKCDKIVTLSAIGKTICKCGEIVDDVQNDKNGNRINGETTHEEV